MTSEARLEERRFGYRERRAEVELKAAMDASHPAVVRAHYRLACLYLERLYGPDPDGRSDVPYRAQTLS